jgi:hypothetical protein
MSDPYYTTECAFYKGALYYNRLRNLADIVARREYFNMATFGNGCGTPACALGSYRDKNPGGRWNIRSMFHPRLHDEFSAYDSATHEFGLTRREYRMLFSTIGCGNACTDNKKAARYIRVFIRRKFGAA